MLRRNASKWAAVLAFGAFAACDFGSVQVLDPPPAQRTDVTLVLMPAAADEEVSRLGWTALPGAEVRVLDAAGEPVTSGTAGADGRVQLGELAVGSYTLDIVRVLDAEEQERAGNPDLVGFAEELPLFVSAGAPEIEVSVHASYRGGLVISETYGRGLQAPGVGGSYHGSTYLEIYNNSDSAIDLDGIIVVMGWRFYFNTVPLPCSESRQWRVETHYYGESFAWFPSPSPLVPPGGTLVIAEDAVDHSALDPAYVNLSRADFEFLGGGDPDNPQVPNMINGGEPAPYGHGIHVDFYKPLFLAAPGDVSTLPVRPTPYDGRRWFGFPSPTIVDFWYERGHDWPGSLTMCPDDILPTFDRAPAQILVGYPRDPSEAVHRKVIAYTPDGREILQDTRSSRSDLKVGVRSPGAVGTTVVR